jgi:hypothetical protein
MKGDLQRINLRVTQLERNNRKLRSKIVKLEKEKLELDMDDNRRKGENYKIKR